VLNLNATNGLPTRNFRDGVFEQADRISAERMRDSILAKRDTCYACALVCKRVVKLDKPYHVDPTYGGPEYETLGAFGSNCAVGELEVLVKANEICAANGLDTISAGNAIAFAMECAERGLIPGNSAGVPVKFGSAESMMGLLNLIIRREGIGKILGEGVKRASEQIGGSSSEFAMHIKGQEVPMHDPRIKHAMGLGYAVSPTGPDHMHNIMDPIYEKETQDLKDVTPLGIIEPLPAMDLSPSKVRLFMYVSLWRHFYNCAVVCLFLKYEVRQMIEWVNAATGWNTSSWELMKVAERAVNMTRIFNIREGFTSKDDLLPQRFYEQQEKGLERNNLNKESLEKAKKLYYAMMGWSEAGVPSAAKLHELNLGWLCDDTSS
jgi:aldehyde:ferredoxin oxidoreductase